MERWLIQERNLNIRQNINHLLLVHLELLLNLLVLTEPFGVNQSDAEPSDAEPSDAEPSDAESAINYDKMEWDPIE